MFTLSLARAALEERADGLDVGAVRRDRHVVDAAAREEPVPVLDVRLRGGGELLAHGATPMLYADADYPASNRAYQKIGFEKAGEVTQYRFDR